jgi:hypothetical protein
MRSAGNKELKTGVIHNEHINDYHGNDSISSSKLKTFLSTPRAFYGTHVTKEFPSTFDVEVGKLGNAFHCLSLEGAAKYNEEYKVLPEGSPKEPTELMRNRYFSGKGKPAENERVEFWDKWDCDNRTDLKSSHDSLCKTMLKSVLNHKTATEMIASGEPEVGFRTKRDGLYLQCRADCLIDKGDHYEILDVKTTGSSLEKASNAIFDYRYDVQAAFYSKIIQEVTSKPVTKFTFLFVEKKPPHQCQLVTVSGAVLHNAMKVVDATLDKIFECYKTGVWPKPASEVNFEDIATVYQLRDLGVEV